MRITEIQNIGPKIKKERKARGYSQSELSKKLDISPSYLNLLESGQRRLTALLLIKVGNELGLSPEDILQQANKKILSDMREVLKKKIFESFSISNQEINDFTNSNLKIAKAFIALNKEYELLNQNKKNKSKNIKTELILDSDKKEDSIDDNIHYSQRFGWTLKKKLPFKIVNL